MSDEQLSSLSRHKIAILIDGDNAQASLLPQMLVETGKYGLVTVRRKYSQMLKKGGPGDTPRTLAVCRVLAADHEDMVVKALS